MAKRMHCLQSPEEIAKRLRVAEMKKRKHAGKHTAYGEQVVSDEDVEKWDMVGLFQMPKEERYALYLSIDYKEECVNKPKRQKAAFGAEVLQRASEQVEEGEKAQLKRAAQQAQHLVHAGHQREATAEDDCRGQ